VRPSRVCPVFFESKKQDKQTLNQKVRVQLCFHRTKTHSRLALLFSISVAAGCTLPQPAPVAKSTKEAGRPIRIVSLDYCADQFVLKLARRENIVALSPDATRDFSYMRQQAKGLPKVRPDTEAILSLSPDLVVRSYGGGPNTKAFLEQAGVKVHQIGWGEGFEAVRTNVREAAKAIGQVEAGEAVVADFDRRLANLKPADAPSALYMTRGGITSGPGSMIDVMMTTAGLTNFQAKKGWNQLPLEQLATQRPDMAVAAFFGTGDDHQDYWSSARHPIARDILTNLPVAKLDGSTTTCGGWFVVDAIEMMAAQGLKAKNMTGHATVVHP
jgi:iron complex transport system substrate-binding protein